MRDLYYNNPDDDELIVRRRGMNVPNFGNRMLWVLVGVLTATAVLMTLLPLLG